MAATPKTGVIIFRGLQTGTIYQKPIYNADVVGTLCRIDNGTGTPGAAGGADFCKFDENISLVDCAFVTGTVDTQNLRLMINYNPTVYTINWPTYVNTLAYRPPLNINIAEGKQISLQQIA